MREETLQAGLLMESAQAHQAMVTENMQLLQAHIRDMDVVVRDEIRRTLLEELQAVSVESRRAVQALRQAGQSVGRSHALLLHFLVLLLTLLPAAAIYYATPSSAEITARRAQRADLDAAIARLKAQGGLVQWRRCGQEGRLCVRIDRKSPFYGEQADFLIVNGY